ncbi:hypothetical protein B0X61_02615 [Helicobacter pylori]|nr:hypothetical protein B0X61_02615 [Helicobacter pylori]
MAETLYLKISFLGCKAVVFLKIFNFRGFLLEFKSPPFFKKEGLNHSIRKHIIEIHAIKPSIF